MDRPKACVMGKSIYEIYRIMLELNGKALLSRHENKISTWFRYHEYLFSNKFVINYDDGEIERLGPETAVLFD